MRIIELQNLDDPGLDVYARLTEAQLRSRVEPARGEIGRASCRERV